MLHFFSVPALDSQRAQDELNRFCAAHRVVTLQREFVTMGANSYWAICVTVASGEGTLPDSLKAPERRAGTGRIDYKQVLSEEEFLGFARLRNWRKATADGDGVPVYTVFTNEQLVEIARRQFGRAGNTRRPRLRSTAPILGFQAYTSKAHYWHGVWRIGRRERRTQQYLAHVLPAAECRSGGGRVHVERRTRVEQAAAWGSTPDYRHRSPLFGYGGLRPMGLPALRN
jgi:hypothetical protein